MYRAYGRRDALVVLWWNSRHKTHPKSGHDDLGEDRRSQQQRRRKQDGPEHPRRENPRTHGAGHNHESHVPDVQGK